MKRKIFIYLISIIIIFVVVCSYFFNIKNDDKKLEKVTLAEVAHTVFYAPMYVAIEKGYFEENGINIDLILTSGADKVTAAVLSGDAQIGFSGSEATIYVYNGGEKDYLKTFGQLTQRDGSFIVSREKIDNFTLDSLLGKTVIGGRAGGMPEMTFEYALKQNGIDPRNDLDIDTSVAFPAMGGAFISGQGDFVTLFEPTASQVEKQGYGYVVESVGKLGGNVPYTSFSARKSYLNTHKELIKNFDKAIQKGLNYVHKHSDRDVALAIINQFPDSKVSELEDAIKRYRENDTWPTTTKFSKSSFDHLQDIMIDYGEITKKVPYSKLMYKIK